MSHDDPTNKELYVQAEGMTQEIAQNVQAVADRLEEKIDQVNVNFVQQVESVKTDSAQQVAQAESDHRIDLLLERMGANEAKAKVEVDRKFNKYFLWVVTAFGILILLSAVGYFQLLNPQAGKTLFILGDPVVEGPTELCPGESLDFSVSVDVSEKGVYVLDQSTWQVDPPPATVILSEGQRMVIGNNRSFPIARKWIIPKMYLDPATNELAAWIPGKFSRDISVTAGGKNVESSTKSIPFSIREGCPE